MNKVSRDWTRLCFEQSLDIRNTQLSHVSFSVEPCVALNGVRLEGSVSFGFSSYVNSGSSVKHSTFGRFCSIGEDVMFSPNAHPKDWLSTSPVVIGQSSRVYNANDGRECSVGHDVWIGSRAIVMGGVTIGDGAIVAANSVVTGSVEAYSIVAGAPARKVGQRFNNEIVAELLELRWWELDIRSESLDQSDIVGCLTRLRRLRSEGRFLELVSARILVESLDTELLHDCR